MRIPDAKHTLNILAAGFIGLMSLTAAADSVKAGNVNTGSKNTGSKNNSGFELGLEAGATRGEGAGPVNTSIYVAGQNFSDTGTLAGLWLGYRVNDWLSFRLRYADLGELAQRFRIRPDIVFIVQPNDEQRFEARALSASVLLSWPISRDLSLYGEAGMAQVQADEIWSGGFSPMSGSTRMLREADEQSPLLGVGLSFALDSKTRADLKVQRMEVLDLDVDVISIGISERF